LSYGIEDHTVVVTAVAHTHREPQEWVDRFRQEIVENGC
jgi:hypothetical protein